MSTPTAVITVQYTSVSGFARSTIKKPRHDHFSYFGEQMPPSAADHCFAAWRPDSALNLLIVSGSESGTTGWANNIWIDQAAPSGPRLSRRAAVE